MAKGSAQASVEQGAIHCSLTTSGHRGKPHNAFYPAPG